MSDTQSRIALIGGGGHAAVVADAAARAGFDLGGFFDDDAPARLFDLERLGTIESVGTWNGPVHIALGHLSVRRSMIEQTEPHQRVTIVHPTAVIAESAAIGSGCFAAAGVIVNPRARVGEDCILNTGSVIEHDCEIGHNAHIAPGTVLGGGVRIGTGTLVGLGSRVLPGLTIGSGCIVGSGAVVTRDVEDGAVVKGVPAG